MLKIYHTMPLMKERNAVFIFVSCDQFSFV